MVISKAYYYISGYIFRKWLDVYPKFSIYNFNINQNITLNEYMICLKILSICVDFDKTQHMDNVIWEKWTGESERSA